MADEKKKRRQGVPTSLRPAIWARTQGHCHFCGQLHAPDGDWQSDHVLPWASGGRNNLENLLLVCPECNGGGGRWDRGGPRIRELIRLGILANNLIKGKGKLRASLRELPAELLRLSEEDLRQKVDRSARARAANASAPADETAGNTTEPSESGENRP